MIILLDFSNDAKRKSWDMLCLYYTINDSSGCWLTTIYVAVMFQASWHTAEGNYKSRVSNIKSWCIAKAS